MQASAPAIKAEIKPQTSGTIKISVNDAEMKFVGSPVGTAAAPSAFVSDIQAEIGLIQIENLSITAPTPGTNEKTIMDSTGAAEFKFTGAAGSADTLVSTTLNILEITDGQFDASTGSDMVYIDVDRSGSKDATEPAAIVDATTNKATFTLTDAHMLLLIGAGPFPIRMIVNTTTVINTVENPPKATLTIDFKQGDAAESYGVEGQVVAGEVSQIKRNGTVCIVYNVHKGEATMPADYSTNPTTGPYGSYIRVTNRTGVDGKLTGLLYATDGTALGSGTLIEALNPGVTEVIDSWEIRQKLVAGGTWKGRAMLFITSTLSKMEMLALLRHQPGAPLTNVSVGASGPSCTN